MTCRTFIRPAPADIVNLAAERLVRRQLRMVGRSAGLTPGQASWCRATFTHYVGLERAAAELRRRACLYRSAIGAAAGLVSAASAHPLSGVSR